MRRYSGFKINTINDAPYKCIFCNSTTNSFSSEEHIVPESLGNNFLVLGKGWLCDNCNNICSSFESRVLNNTFFGLERVLLGVTTKKGKKPRVYYDKVYWYTEKESTENFFSIDEKSLEKNPFLKNSLLHGKKFILPFHTKYDEYIARFLLKIGIETINIYKIGVKKSFFDEYDFIKAKNHILDIDNNIWPYVVVNDQEKLKKNITGIFDGDNYLKSHLLSSHFNLYLYQVDNSIILYFEYGRYILGINLSSRDLSWLDNLKDDNIKFIVNPIEFSEKSFD